MDEQFFDDLAKGLGDGTISRSRALKLVGAALLATMIPPLFPRPAVASAKKRCKKRKGTFLTAGECNCAWTCNTRDFSKFVCNGNPNCQCSERLDGSGFCADFTGAPPVRGCS